MSVYKTQEDSEVEGIETFSDFIGASCMAAPCSRIGWGNGCKTTCLCPRYSGSDESTLEDGCVLAGFAQSVDCTLTELYAFIQSLQTRFKNMTMEAVSARSQCGDICSVP